MDIKIINIGNSKGIILPSIFLKILKLDTGSKLNLEVNTNTKEIIIKTQIRVGWAEAFRNYSIKDEDELLIPDIFNDEKI